MGIDYGAHRVGLALSDDGGTFALPKVVFLNDHSLLEEIEKLIEQEHIETIVLGEADNPAGGENTIQRRLLTFKNALEVRTGKTVEMVSEAYTSAQARRAWEEKIRSRKDKRIPVDAAAAALILQTYLDQKRV